MAFFLNSLVLLVAQAGLFGAFAKESAPRKCHTANDLAILLDSSASMQAKGFDQAKEFAQELTSRFSVSANKTRVSLMAFSHYARIAFKFKDLYPGDLVRDAVSNLTYEGSLTGTSKALSLMTSQLFTAEGGARLMQPGVKLVAVLVTDGRSGGGIQSMMSRSQKIQQRGVELFVVGMGPGIDKKQLEALGSDPKSQHVIIARRHESIKHLVDEIVLRICKPRVYF